MPYGEPYGDYADTGSSSAKSQSEGQGQTMSFVQGLFGGLVDVFGNASTNNENAYRAAQQREWQDYMSSSAHRRETQDLMSAGLNPILTATGGSGASGGSGGMIPAANATQGAVDAFTKMSGGASARETERMQRDLINLQQENTAHDTELKDATTSKLNQDYNTGIATQHNTEQSTRESESRQKLVDSQKEGQDILNKLTQKKIPQASTMESVWGGVDKGVKLLKQFSDWVGSAGGAQIDQGIKDLPKAKDKVLNKLKDTFPGAFDNPSSAKGGTVKQNVRGATVLKDGTLFYPDQ